MEVHADILKMAKTKEKRETIKWFYARQVFFFGAKKNNPAFSQGFALARQSEHEDARLLVSLFPNGAPASEQEAAKVFLARKDDARCLCWAGLCNTPGWGDLLLRSANAGYAWGQAKCGSHMVEWLEKAAAQGDCEGMRCLAYELYDVASSRRDTARALKLWQEAALLGDAKSQFYVAKYCCVDSSLEQAMWLRRSALQFHQTCLLVNDGNVAGHVLLEKMEYWVRMFDKGSSGRILFEYGAAYHGNIERDINKLLGIRSKPREVIAAERAVEVYLFYCAQAKRGVLCWMWLSKMKGVAKDIRLSIADLIWEQRAEWCYRERPSPPKQKIKK